MIITRKTIIVGIVIILTALSNYMLQFSNNPAVLRWHIFAIAGTFLMLQTEITYTLRKKKFIKSSSPKKWLQLHIFTGLLGVAFILYHTNWNFYGFAGFVTYLTLLVTASGFFGYYIYRSIPRTLRGKERNLKDLINEQKQLESKLRELMKDNPETLEKILKLEILTPRGKGITEMMYAANDYYQARRKIHRLVNIHGFHPYNTYKQLENIAFSRLDLERRVILLSNSKKILSNWNKFHKPVTLTLFLIIAIHILSIFYYGKSF